MGFLFNGKTYIVKIDSVICDAPARAFIKCIRPHSAYNSCERCMQRGKWCNKVTLPNLEAPPITDLSFIERHYSDHHVGSSPLEHLGCGMVTEFPLEYMHLVCLGVMRRLLFQWIHGPRGDCKLSQLQSSMISNNVAVIRKHISREFSRKPLSLLEYKKWKATELRQFLLYTGPVVLKTILKDTIYSNFLDLSVAIQILLSPNLLSKNIAYAEQFLKYFVVTFSKLYGENQLVYNIHFLIHLPSDAKHCGVLDNISAFQYESYLGRLKKLVHKPQNPTGQIVRRIIEGHCNINDNTSNKKEPMLKRIHLDGPIPVD